MGIGTRGAIAAALSVALAGACLGFWMFGFRGLLLFMGVGLGLVLVLDALVQIGPRSVAGLALLLAGLALYSASTLGWGAADVPDGTRYKASPVGLSHVLTPNQPVSKTIDCGWYAISGYTASCTVAPEGQAAFRQLRAVYPLVIAATACCVLGAILSMAPARYRRRVVVPFAAGAAFGSVLAVILFANSLGTALHDLRGLGVGTGGTLGTMELAVAVLLCLTVALLPGESRPRRSLLSHRPMKLTGFAGSLSARR